MSYTRSEDGFYHVPIIDLGKRLRDNFGLTIKEHAAFGGVDPGAHAPGGHHYTEHGALDVQDWRDDVIDGVSWQNRTKNLYKLLQGSGAEILGPGDRGHDTHVHLAGHDGIFKLNQQQYDTLFGGNAGGLKATFASFTPPSTPQTPEEGPKPERVEAVTRAKEYSKMSKAEMNSAYDDLRKSDPAKAAIEGKKMHRAFFGK